MTPADSSTFDQSSAGVFTSSSYRLSGHPEMAGVVKHTSASNRVMNSKRHKIALSHIVLDKHSTSWCGTNVFASAFAARPNVLTGF